MYMPSPGPAALVCCSSGYAQLPVSFFSFYLILSILYSISVLSRVFCSSCVEKQGLICKQTYTTSI